MSFLNIDSVKKRTFDAIVIGSGISGGWAAKELCEKGLKTLVLERGRDVKHVTDYPTTMKNPWEFEHRGQVPLDIRNQYPNGRTGFMREETMHWSLKPNEQPYIEEKPFQWTRGYHVGGKSLLWARQTQRWSDLDFEGPKRDGYAVDWPIRYADIAPWYSHVEKFAGISGNKDNLPQLPDGEFLPPFEMSCVEEHFKGVVSKNYQNRPLIHGRCAHITEPKQIHFDQGRATCQNRNLCNRGCPYGGYFSSNASTLPWAMKTGKMTLRPDSVVHSIIYDEKNTGVASDRATGVRVVDAHTKEIVEYFAKIIFVNASALDSNLILLNSISNRFPNGIGNDSGTLGKYVACHNYRGKLSADVEGFLDKKTDGKNPSNAYFPRFRNLYKQETDFLRGYSVGVGSGRGLQQNSAGVGEELKQNLLNPKLENWHISSWMQGETIPIESNHVRLHTDLTDHYGIPQLITTVDWTVNDDKLVGNTLGHTLKEARESFEINYITNQLKKNKGNISKTADYIGMERSALHRKLKSLGIKGLN